MGGVAEWGSGVSVHVGDNLDLSEYPGVDGLSAVALVGGKVGDGRRLSVRHAGVGFDQVSRR